jgi:YihY family inner membrane protein
VEDIAASAGKPAASAVATVAGIALALLGASGVFGQLQDALNTIWDVKPKPGRSLVSFLRARFLSFAMVAGVCFLLLVSLTASAVITAVGGYLEHLLPGGNVLAWAIHLVLDIGIVTLLFAMIFKFLPDARLSWRDVRLGATLTSVLFLVGKYARALYLGSGAPGSAYGAAGSLSTMLIWIYYAAQIVLFGGRVYSSLRPGTWARHSSGKACGARRSKGNRVTTINRSGRQVSLTSNKLLGAAFEHRGHGDYQKADTLAWFQGFEQSELLSYPPRPDAIFFVVAWPLIHDVRPVLIPDRRIFIIQSINAFRNARECAESSSSRKIQNNYLLPWILVYDF